MIVIIGFIRLILFIVIHELYGWKALILSAIAYILGVFDLHTRMEK